VRAVRVSLSFSDLGAGDVAPLLAAAQTADEAGIDTLWVPDHLLQADPFADADGAMFEGYTLLGHLAAVTRRIRLGTLVSAVSYRPAALLVKAVTTLDVLSGGRAWFGVGAGYLESEAADMGLPLPAGVPERFELLEETLRLARQMWAGDDRPFGGTQVRAARPVAVPRPVSAPRPRVLIGGMGERRTLPLVVRHADACNLFDIPDGGATLRRKLALLDRLCEQEGRDPATVERTVATRLGAGEGAAAFGARCEALGALGLDHVVVLASGPWSPERVRLVATATG
jgi:alkanesulfonate monooxygenase SsuD/methylene tetrahydromethanopterin reductase-like flavin-dependent oxidoreductase (luciferase family)